MAFDFAKYKPFPQIHLDQRRWPERRIEKAPRWCSVDLRDGNQALIEPMTTAQKMKMFELLVDIGFSEIEVGFPAASRADLEFVRELIDARRIPDHVTIQVLTQARPEIIRRTFDAVEGAGRVIMHVYNPTSPLQRDKVFRTDKAGIIEIAVNAAKNIQRHAAAAPRTEWTFQYSPESFTATELDFAVDICNRVSEVWQPAIERPMIMTLPATVEMATPNVYADQIEWFCANLKNRDAVVVGTHTHNDRGCAVAAAELAVMAGAQRVEGTLLGNGERSGNMDILVMAMNLYSRGVDPRLDFSDMDRIVSVVTSCTQIELHPRHPYCGDLIFTAFSGGHQDAIKKCLDDYQDGMPWEVAYLPIDPRDVGRNYQDVIRINSQSGKGGVAYVLEHKLGVRPPRWLQVDFSRVVQRACDDSGKEVSADQIWVLFGEHYLRPSSRLRLKLHRWRQRDPVAGEYEMVVGYQGNELRLHGEVGQTDMLLQQLNAALGLDCELLDERMHYLTDQLRAIRYVRMRHEDKRYIGVAIGSSQWHALTLAVLSALDRVLESRSARPVAEFLSKTA
jgi:2-isopropylmalate synthase